MSDHPRRIGPYRLVRKLGEGGMGVVHLAHDAAFNLVALKVLRPDAAGRADFRRRFTREAEAARKVARFCTAPILDAGLDGETAYLVTEYIDGPHLGEVVAAQGAMTGANLEALAVGVATALAAIHEAGVVHLDLKPSNILLSAVGPRVIDFGVARLLAPDETQSVTVAGTPAYMAPERVDGVALPAADVFAWGGVVTFAGTKEPPFGTGQAPEVLYRIAHDAPKLDGLDERLRPLVELALEKDPARRPTAQQLLDRLLGRERVTAASATGVVSDAWTPVPPPPAEPVRRWPAAVAAGVAAAVVGVGGTFAALKPWDTPGAVAATERTVTQSATVRTVTLPRRVTVTVTDSPPTPSGSITPGRDNSGRRVIFDSGGNEGIRAFVQIKSLTWQGDNLRLEWTVRNDSADENLYVTSMYSDDTRDTSVRPIELFAVDGQPPFRPMSQDGACVCTGWRMLDALAAGATQEFFAEFRAVPKSVTTVDLDLRSLGRFENVAVTQS